MTETVADILREMREDDVRLTSDDVSKAEKKALKWACDWCKGYANRIDAALAAELAAAARHDKEIVKYILRGDAGKEER